MSQIQIAGVSQIQIAGVSQIRISEDCGPFRRMLRAAGARVADPTPAAFNRLAVDLWPRVSWTPAFAQVTAGAAVERGWYDGQRAGSTALSAASQGMDVFADGGGQHSFESSISTHWFAGVQTAAELRERLPDAGRQRVHSGWCVHIAKQLCR